MGIRQGVKPLGLGNLMGSLFQPVLSDLLLSLGNNYMEIMNIP